MGIQNGEGVTVVTKVLSVGLSTTPFPFNFLANIFFKLSHKMGFLRFTRGAFAYAGCLGVYARNYTGVWGRAGTRVRNYSKDETIRDVTAQYACYHLPHRTIIKLQGEDTSPFLQGLITNDIGLLEEPGKTAMYAHMLNVQGRTLYDIILYRYNILYICMSACLSFFSKPKGVTSYLAKQLLIDPSGKVSSF